MYIYLAVKRYSGPFSAHVLFSTSVAAQEAVNKLHAHVFKGSLLSVTLKKRFDSLSKVSVAPAKSSSTVTAAAPNRASRLIVRNIPFDVSEQDLRAIFLPHGPIYSIHIPKEKEGGKGKGFAFVWMLSKKDAERALEKCNGTALRAGMAEGLVQDKQKKKKVRREEKKRKAAVKEEEGDDEEVQDMAKVTDERVIAVDWALSKEKWQEEQAKMEVDEGNEAMDDVKSEDASDDGSDSDESSDDENCGVHHNGSESSSEEDSDEGDDFVGEEQEPVKPQLPPPETGTTLFVRNVPFAATEDELRTL